MDAHGNFPFLKETILFLALSGVLMPLLSRLRPAGQSGVYLIPGQNR